MSKLKIAELFYSIQGEGKYQGASGKVYVYNDENLTRSVKIIVHY